MTPEREDSETRVMIWSGEHHAYWRPNSAGYTADGLEAGVFDLTDAERIIRNVGPDKKLKLCPLGLTNVHATTTDEPIVSRDEAQREQIATFVERYAERLANGPLKKEYGNPINRHRYSSEESALIRTVVKSMAGSIRAGLGVAEADWPVAS